MIPVAMQGEYVSLPQEKVIYGSGSLQKLANETERLERKRALIITGRSIANKTPLIDRVSAVLGTHHVGTFSEIRQHTPESGIVAAAELAQSRQADLLVSIGGGSPIDAAKIVAHRLAAGDDNYLPHIAVPTTLSAAEFSNRGGYTDEATKSKTGVGDLRMTPRVVILDPDLTLSTPMWLWLTSGMRAVDHAVETLYSPGDHPVSDVLALQALHDLFEFLPRTKAEPDDVEARLRCQLATWMSYFSPASVGAHLGTSHHIGKRIGATYDVPHGVTSGILLPHVMRAKAASEAARLAPIVDALKLEGEFASERDAALAAVDAVAALVERLEVPARLRDVELPREALESVAKAAYAEPAEQQQARDILNKAW